MSRPSVPVVDGRKRCTGCGEVKLLEDFGSHAAGAGGRRSKCKACSKQLRAVWREANRERVRRDKRESWARHKTRLNKERRERRDEAVLERERRWRQANRDKLLRQQREYARQNRERRREWSRRWYAENGLAWVREWRAKHPEKVREANHRRRAAVRSGSPDATKRIAELLQEPCAYCGSTERIEVDHIVPLIRGGRHVPENLAPACITCNRSKGDKLLEEWMEGVSAHR